MFASQRRKPRFALGLVFASAALVAAACLAPMPAEQGGTALITPVGPGADAPVNVGSRPTSVQQMALTAAAVDVSPTESRAPGQPQPLSPTPTFIPLPTPANVAKPGGLTEELLKNGAYELPDSGMGPFRLTEGVYEIRSGPGFSQIQRATFEKAAFGDLNGDGVTDAALILSLWGGGTGHFKNLVAVLGASSGPQQAAVQFLGDRFSIKSITINDRQITIDMLVQGPGDGLCCPSQREIRTYRLAGSRLELVPRSEPPAGSATPRPPIGTVTAEDQERIAAIYRLLDVYSESVWRGWQGTRTPLLLRAGADDYLIGHPHPPAEFVRLPGEVGSQPVYRFQGHTLPVVAATAWNVAGVWCVAVPVRDEFQQAIDAQLGPGAVKLDDAAYVESVVHEAFHAYQMALTGGNVEFGGGADDPKAIAAMPAIPDLAEQQAAEGRALLTGLDAANEDDARAAAARFVQLRQARRVAHPEVAGYERTIEWTEGLARYADVSVMRLAAGAEGSRQPLLPNDGWAQFRGQLADVPTIPGGMRDRYELLGAGEAFLLDRLLPGWQQRALPGGEALESLLAEAA